MISERGSRPRILPASDDLLAATELAYGRRYQKAVHLHSTGQLRSRVGAGAATPLATPGAGAVS
jgi:hypothetical protein